MEYCPKIYNLIEGVRFYERENTIEVVGSSFCNVWPVFGLSAVGVTYWNLVLIIVNRTLLIWNPNLAKRQDVFDRIKSCEKLLNSSNFELNC